MVIEHFREDAVASVYERFAEKGRMMPGGLNYVDSWIEVGLNRCFQVMETEEPALLQQWVSNWNDLIDFEIVPVVTSVETRNTFGFGT